MTVQRHQRQAGAGGIENRPERDLRVAFGFGWRSRRALAGNDLDNKIRIAPQRQGDVQPARLSAQCRETSPRVPCGRFQRGIKQPMVFGPQEGDELAARCRRNAILNLQLGERGIAGDNPSGAVQRHTAMDRQPSTLSRVRNVSSSATACASRAIIPVPSVVERT